MPQEHRTEARRRAAKIGAVTVTSSLLVGVVAAGAWALPARLAPNPEPPAASAPKAGATSSHASASADPARKPTPKPKPKPKPKPPTPSPTPTTDPTSRTALEDPRFAEGQSAFAEAELNGFDGLTDILCGDPVTELLDLPNPGGLEMSLLEADVTGGRVSITNNGATDLGPDHVAVAPRLVFVQDGRIVDGDGMWMSESVPFEHEDGSTVTSLPPGESFTTAAHNGDDDGDWTCGTRVELDGPDAHPDNLPPGDYDVYAVALYFRSGETGASYAVTEKLRTTVAAPPAVSRSALDDPRFAAGEEAFADAGLNNFTGLMNLRCGDSVIELRETLPNYAALGIALEGGDPGRGRVSITNYGAELGPDDFGAGPYYVIAQDGRIVDGANVWMSGFTTLGTEDGSTLRLPPYESTSLAFQDNAPAEPGWTCGTRIQDPDGAPDSFPDTLPAGDYQVYALVLLARDGESEVSYVVSDPGNLTIP